MTNKKFIKFLSIFMLAIMLVSTFATPVFAMAEGEATEEAAPTIWEQILGVITSILAVIVGVIFFILYTIFILFSALVNLLFVVGEAIVTFVMTVVNYVVGLF